MLTIFLKILVIFIMVAVGFIANKVGVLPDSANKPLVDLLMDITMPCLLISSMATIELTRDGYVHTAQVMIGSAVYFIVIILFSYLVVKAMRYHPAEDEGVLMVLITSINTGFMGFPITASIFGEYFLFLMVMENVLLNVYLFILSPIQLRAGGKGGKGFGSAVKSLINPCNAGVIIGVILLFGHITLPGPIMESIDTIGDATIPVSMIVVGLQLGGSRFRDILGNGKLVLTCLVHVFAVPVLVFLVTNWLPIAAEAKLTLIFASCFPSAVAPVWIAARDGKNSRLMAEGVSLTTLLSMISLPAAAVFLMHWYGF